MSRRRRKHGIKWRSVYQWHRMIGLTVAILVLFLAVTGIVINHTNRLGLDHSYVQSDWLLDWYGIRLPEQPHGFKVDDSWVSQIGQRLYFGDRELKGDHARLIGAVQVGKTIVIAAGDKLLLLTIDGRLIEQLSGSDGVPSGMRAIGIMKPDRLAVQAAHGVYHSDKEFSHWRKQAAQHDNWAQPTAVPESLKQKLSRLYRGRGLSHERVLLDLHTGRLFGGFGVMVMDAAAIMLLLLALSGTWLWLKRKR